MPIGQIDNFLENISKLIYDIPVGGKSTVGVGDPSPDTISLWARLWKGDPSNPLYSSPDTHY